MIGLFSDSYGDLEAFDAAYELLRAKGAKRFFFAGGRYADLDEWLLRRRQKARGGRAYSDADFLADVSSWVANTSPSPRPKAENTPDEDAVRIKERFVRVPERECLQYLDPNVTKKAIDMLSDHLCCIVHDKNDLTRDDLINASVFVHGKEPEPRVVQIGPRCFVTPGKLTGAAEQTCGLLQIVERSIHFSAFSLDGRVLVDGQDLALDKRVKLSVK